MIIKFKDFEIEKDKHSFILNEYWNIKDKKTGVLEYKLKNKTYPVNLENCILKILDRKIYWNGDMVSLKEFIEQADKIHKEFLTELKMVTNLIN